MDGFVGFAIVTIILVVIGVVIANMLVGTTVP